MSTRKNKIPVKLNKTQLPPAIKKRWVAALRSGKYKQRNEFLYDSEDNSYCCLGVLGSICNVSKRVLDNVGMLYDIGTCNENKLPDAWLIENEKEEPKRGAPSVKDIAHKLANFNDNGKSFKWIAAYIERYL